MDYHILADETLLLLIATDQEGALSALYDRYIRLVYSLALTAVSNQHLAEEITQDVFLRIWEKAETFRAEQGKVSTWIASITRYRSIDMLRRQRVRPEGNQAEWSLEDDPDLADEILVESQVELAQRQQQVRAALRQLPTEQRQALAFAFFHGYSHSQIAEKLGEPLGTVKTRVRLGMQKLRQLLNETLK